MYRTRLTGTGPAFEGLLRVDAARRPPAPASLALALALFVAAGAAAGFGLCPTGWPLAAVFFAAGALACKALVPALMSHWLDVGPADLQLWARLGPFAAWPLGALPFEAGLSVRATPLGGRLPPEVELSIEGQAGRLTWRTLGLEASARVQDRVLDALNARLAPGRPGSFHGGRLQVRRAEGRLEIGWPGDAPSAARTRRRLALSLGALAVAAAGPSLAPAAAPGACVALAGAALAAALIAVLRAPAGPSVARATLVLTPKAWRLERRGLFWRASREGAGPLRAGPGRTGPGPRRDVESAAEGRVALAPPGRRAFEVGGSLTLRERRWLVELVECFHDVARPR